MNTHANEIGRLQQPHEWNAIGLVLPLYIYDVVK